MIRSHLRHFILLAAGILALSSARAASPDLAASVVPGDSEAFIHVDLTAFDNANSLLNMIPRAEVENRIAETMEREGLKRTEPAVGSGEAVLRIAFDKDVSTVFESLSLSVINSDDLQTQDDYAVLRGNFTIDEIASSLSAYGISAGPTQQIGIFPSFQDNPVYIRTPTNGVLLLSNSLDWIKGVEPGQTTGFAAAGSAYSQLAKSVTTKPDGMIYLSGELFSKAAAGDPMAMAFLGPFMKMEGATLFLLPGDVPSLQLRGLLPDEQNAELGRQYLEQMIIILRAQVENAVGSLQGGRQRRDAMKTLEMLDQLELSTEGSFVIATAVLDSLPDREEFQERFLQGVEDSLTEGLPMGGNLIGN